MPNTLKFVYKKNGKDHRHIDNVGPAMGRPIRHRKGTNTLVRPYNTVAVYDKQ